MIMKTVMAMMKTTPPDAEPMSRGSFSLMLDLYSSGRGQTTGSDISGSRIFLKRYPLDPEDRYFGFLTPTVRLAPLIFCTGHERLGGGIPSVMVWKYIFPL